MVRKALAVVVGWAVVILVAGMVVLSSNMPSRAQKTDPGVYIGLPAGYYACLCPIFGGCGCVVPYPQ